MARNYFLMINIYMGFVGNILGRNIGWATEKIVGKTEGIDATKFGGYVGRSLVPFKNGGLIKGIKRNKPKIILAHVGEYVLPVGIKPTKIQRKKVNALKQKNKSKK